MCIKAFKPIVQTILKGRLYICQGVDVSKLDKRFTVFKPKHSIRYDAFCDDFGPMNMSSIIRFIQQLDDELELYSVLTYVVASNRREFTNAIFLLGAYLIIRGNLTVNEVVKQFGWLDQSMVENYRDATYISSDFRLTLEDCWMGLAKGMEHGWIRAALPTQPYRWGMIDIDEYEHYDSPLNGDLNIVVPGKFIALRGPCDLGGVRFRDDCGLRAFSPEHYVDILKHLGATGVVRLNAPAYNPTGFLANGMPVHPLAFDDCTTPPQHLVDAFLNLADSADGPLAVHCMAGLGRTGTLVAAYLMCRHGFSAREAMAWLRIMRPGSVIGEQQHFLAAMESCQLASDAKASGAAQDQIPVGGAAAAATSAACACAAEQVACGAARRSAAKARGVL